MSAQLSVVAARVALAQAEVRAADERRAALTKQLGEVRAELKTARKTFDKLAKQVMAGQAKLDAIHSNQMFTMDALGRLQSVKPAAADFLPGDPEAVEWADNCRILSERLEKLKREKLTLPMEALRLEGVQLRDRIQQLAYAESTLLNDLHGAVAAERVGGVFAPGL